MQQSVTILGATGSIGESTLSVLSLHPERFKLHAVSANKNVSEMFAICKKYQPEIAVMVDAEAAEILQDKLTMINLTTVVQSGSDALCKIASAEKVDVVVAGIVGAAGLSSCFAAAEAGKKILLANKESLVIAGSFLLDAAKQNAAELIPLDSEHNAIFQCHPLARAEGEIGGGSDSVNKVFLTASGGPFLNRDLHSFALITPAEACAHPRWEMGRKISVDSATMMNKGLEFIEAAILFGLAPEKIEVVIHPQSIVHSMVEYIDGSVLAQLGSADMRIPIAHALGFPERLISGAKQLSIKDFAQLQFIEPCNERFPALELAQTAAADGKVLPIILNAANEVCVDEFLNEQTSFPSITQRVAEQMQNFAKVNINSLSDVMELDHEVRVATRLTN